MNKPRMTKKTDLDINYHLTEYYSCTFLGSSNQLT